MNYVAKAFVYDREGSVLILTRSDTHPRYPLHADLPGGDIEPHESPTTGMLRELQEEAGIYLAESDLRLVSSHIHKEDMTYLLYEAYLPSIRPEIQVSWEHSEYSWQPLQTVLDADQPEGTDSYYLFAITARTRTTSIGPSLSHRD